MPTIETLFEWCWTGGLGDDFDTYHNVEKHHSLCCSHAQRMNVDKNPFQMLDL